VLAVRKLLLSVHPSTPGIHTPYSHIPGSLIVDESCWRTSFFSLPSFSEMLYRTMFLEFGGRRHIHIRRGSPRRRSAVNSRTGSVQPVVPLSRRIRRRRPNSAWLSNGAAVLNRHVFRVNVRRRRRYCQHAKPLAGDAAVDEAVSAIANADALELEL